MSDVFINVTCPECENQETHSYIGAGRNKAICSKCSTSFDFLFVTIRSKRSRGNKQQRTRAFDIRVILQNKDEDFIQFERDEYDDIELRSKDSVVFIYLDDKIRIVSNVTIGLYTVLKKKKFFDKLGLW